MTPAINLLNQQDIWHAVHQYEHDSNAKSYGDEAAQKLGVPAEGIFKTLVVSVDSKYLAVAVIPVQDLLSLKLLAKCLGAKKAVMAEHTIVQRSTGYLLGGISPIAQKVRLKTIINESATELSSIFVSAGRRGLDVELAPHDLAKVCGAEFANITQS